jgi:hypothetical protein
MPKSITLPSEIIDGEGVMHVLTTEDATGDDAPLPLDHVSFNAPDHFAQAAAIDAVFQVCPQNLGSLDDPEDDHVAALPLSFAIY